MRGQVTLPVLLYAFILLIAVSAMLPSLYTSISTAAQNADPTTKVLLYLVPAFFVLGPAVMPLGYHNLSEWFRGRGGEGY